MLQHFFLSFVLAGTTFATPFDLSARSLSPSASSAVCKVVSAVVSKMHQDAAVTPFCSSFLKIPVVTSTSTTTITPPVSTSVSTTFTTSTSITVTTTVTTRISCTSPVVKRNVDMLDARRHALHGLQGRDAKKIRNPSILSAAPNVVLDRRAVATPSCLKGQLSAVISTACGCISMPTSTSTVTASTTKVPVTITVTSVSTPKTVTTTTTTQTVYTTPTVPAICNDPSQSYGLLYNYGYISTFDGQIGFAVVNPNFPSITTAAACCARCFETCGCLLFTMRGDLFTTPGTCNLYVTSAGIGTDDAGGLCPNGIAMESTSGGSAYGLGPCVVYSPAI